MTVEDCEKESTEVLVFMLSSLKQKWKWPIGYWFVDKIKSNVQAQLIRIAITQCDKFGINVVTVTCDGAYANSSTFKTLGCDLDQLFDFIKSDFSITSTKANVYFTPDACHNVKLARNALGTLGVFKDSNNNLIEWGYIHKLFELQNNIGFKLANKINSSHINWKNNSMKVKLAVQTLSSSVADSLQFLSKTSKDFGNCDATIRFIRVVDEIFDFLNSRNPYAKGFKQSINRQNIQYLETKMKNNIDYLYSLKTATGQDLWKSKRKTFILGFAASIKSTIAIAKDLLMNQNFKFILTYKLSQDAIEIFFGFMRGRLGHNNNPTCLQFKHALKSTLLHTSVRLSSGNCILMSPHEDSLFSIKWKYKAPEQNLENELDISLLAEQYNKLDFNSIIIENILYYICGYIVKKLIPTFKCDGCIEAITDSYIENDHVYQNNTTPKYFTIMKNRGGLKYASDGVYKIVKLTETLFKTIMVDKKQMFIKNMDLKIMVSVQNSLATNSMLFSECDTCWDSTDLLARPHKIDIINKVTRTYLNIRLYSYSKIITSSIMKTASKRQKLSKTILFYNM